MELRRKLEILADAAKYDASCASSGTEKRDSRPGTASRGIGSTEGMGICHAYAPDGRCISLLKVLLTNACVFDCAYCVNRAGSNVQRARFTVPELVGLTLDFYRRNYIEGLFLSSGIIRSPDYTMEQVVRGGARAARGPRLPRLHPPQDHPRSLARTAGRGRPLRRPPFHQHRDAARAVAEAPRAREGFLRPSAAPWPGCASGSTRRARPRPPPAAPPRWPTRRASPRPGNPRRWWSAPTRPTTAPCSAPASTSTAATASSASTTPPIRPSPTPRACCRRNRRPCCASTASTRPIGCSASTASNSTRSWPAPGRAAACSTSASTRSSPGRSATATASPWT